MSIDYYSIIDTSIDRTLVISDLRFTDDIDLLQ